MSSTWAAVLGLLGIAGGSLLLRSRDVAASVNGRTAEIPAELQYLTVTRTGLPNYPPPALWVNLRLLNRFFIELKGRLAPKQIALHSAFRSPAVNAAVGGAPGSFHLIGRAADFHVEDPAGRRNEPTADLWASWANQPEQIRGLIEEWILYRTPAGNYIHAAIALPGENPEPLIRRTTRSGGKVLT